MLPPLLTAVAAAAGGGRGPAAVPPLAAAQLPGLDALFEARDDGYLGADVDKSVPRADGTLLWLFGDTLVGRSNATSRLWPSDGMPRQAVGIMRGAAGEEAVDFYWRTEGGAPSSLFVPQQDKEWFWLCDGLEHNGTLALTAMRMGKLDPGAAAGFNFQVKGTSVIVIGDSTGDPSKWEYVVHDVAETGRGNAYNLTWTGLQWVGPPGGAVYVTGDRKQGGCGNEADAILGRVAWAGLLAGLDGVEAWDGAAWGAWPAAGRPACFDRPGSSGFHYNPALGVWHTFSVDAWPKPPTLRLHTAADPTGAWDHRAVFSPPAPYNDTSVQYCYTGVSHPQLAAARGADFVASYICLPWSKKTDPMQPPPHKNKHYPANFVDGRKGMYVPRFVELRSITEA